jgi:hypothetical protein
VDVITPWPHVAEGLRLETVLFGPSSCDRAKSNVCGYCALVRPAFGAIVFDHNLWRLIGVLSWDSPLEDIRGLDYVIIDTYKDEIFELHASTSYIC